MADAKLIVLPNAKKTGKKKHFESCINDYVRTTNERADFEDKYPYFCETCEGWGNVYFIEEADITSDSSDESPTDDEDGDEFSTEFASLAEELESEPCPDCLALLKCPKCGNELDIDDPTEEYTCSFCDAEHTDEGMPRKHKCNC